MLRAGTAPISEDYNFNKKPKDLETSKLFMHNYKTQGLRSPIKPYQPYLKQSNSKPGRKDVSKISPHMSPERSGRMDKDVRQSKLRLGELEDDSDQTSSDTEISRPPSRQNEKAFDLEDRFFTVIIM